MTAYLALDTATATATAFSGNTTLLNDLPDDVFTNVILYCDFASAVAITGTCQSLRRRLLLEADPSSDGYSTRIWRSIYHRHGFCPPSSTAAAGEKSLALFYRKSCHEKRQLLSNLLVGRPQRNRENQKGRCALLPFKLPNRHFYFLPIVPTMADEDYPGVYWDPPPVFWECDSFVLTECGTGSELLLLDPFDGSLRVVNCLQHNTVASDEAMMELALTSAAKAIHDNHDDVSEDEAHVAGAAIEDMIATNHSRHEQPSPPAQCLLPGNDSFELNVTDYFPRVSLESLIHEEFEINFVGTEAKPIWKFKDSVPEQLEGTMVGVGRCVTSLDHEGLICTELTTWTKSPTETLYGHPRRCRFAWAFDCVDMDPCHQRIFCCFAAGQGPDGADPRVISVYPLVEQKEESGSCFPERLLTISCQYAPSTFAIDSTGQTLLVATTRGTLELWKVSETTAVRQERWSLVRRLRSSVRRELTRRTGSAGDGQSREQSHDDQSVSSRFSVLRRQPDLPQFHAPIQSLFVPKHLPVEQSGFVTLHYSREEGSSLLVWKRQQRREDNAPSWDIVSLIHLRLSTRRRPRVQFDGNRIIVFGEDHIGHILLVYQVCGAETVGVEDNANEDGIAGEASGGVYHLAFPPLVRFANRIRHVALDGIEAMDSLHLTCNERFLIVNTRTGNHLGSSPFSEGLLVIDLQDQQYQYSHPAPA